MGTLRFWRKEAWMATSEEIETTLFAIRDAQGSLLSLLQGQEDVCIRRDGELMAGCFWRRTELDKAIEEYVGLARHLSGGARH
jgi:hypothetical protein